MHQRSRACSTPSTKRGSVDEPSAEFQEKLQCFLSRTDRIPNAKNAVILKESEFKNQANHIVHLTQNYTVKLKRTNQLSLEEQDELSSSSAGSKIFPYANASTMQSDLQERVDDMSGKQRKYFDKIKDHVKGIIPSQLRMILSGEGGTGKALIIHAAVLLARIVYGRTGSVFGSVLVIGPTGCAAYNGGGCTWQSALNKRRESKKTRRDLSLRRRQTTSKQSYAE